MDTKYILTAQKEGTADVVTGYADRPKQDEVKEMGEGEYTLRRIDGQVLRHFRVTTNRNGNLTITSITPDGLEPLSALNLERLAKQYIRIVKIWPAQSSAARKIANEMSARARLVAEMTS